jgi:hypothetical protein
VRRPFPVLFLALWLAAAAAGAQTSAAQAPADLELSSLVGLTLPEAFERFGAPAEAFAARGAEDWQDDVVFFYPSHLYLFWNQNRVWQARVDERYGGSFLASKTLAMGAGRTEVLALLGPPMRELGDSLVYHLEDRGYPVRLRLYFREGLLADAYCYRGDL